VLPASVDAIVLGSNTGTGFGIRALIKISICQMSL
jgi:hypothetical protein